MNHRASDSPDAAMVASQAVLEDTLATIATVASVARDALATAVVVEPANEENKAPDILDWMDTT